ncbi:MAG: response regulator [Aureliella sp.]
MAIPSVVAAQTLPEIIFSDITMPIMNAHEFARAIRSHSRLSGVKLVALTGFGQVADLVNAIASGFDEHIVKTVDTRKLRQLLCELS